MTRQLIAVVALCLAAPGVPNARWIAIRLLDGDVLIASPASGLEVYRRAVSTPCTIGLAGDALWDRGTRLAVASGGSVVATIDVRDHVLSLAVGEKAWRMPHAGGPVLTVQPFDTEEVAVARAHDSDYGLCAAVWTQNISMAHRLAKRLRAGNVWVNCYNVFDAALPFGGYKQSGWGREMGQEALNLYLETKAVTVQL